MQICKLELLMLEKKRFKDEEATNSAAIAKDIDVKEGDKVSVYISQPVPCRFWKYSSKYL